MPIVILETTSTKTYHNEYSSYPYWQNFAYDRYVRNLSANRNKGNYFNTTMYWRRDDKLTGICCAAGQTDVYKGSVRQSYWTGTISVGDPVLGTAENVGLSSLVSAARSRAQFALNMKVLNQFPYWDALTDFAELGEAIHLYRSLSSSFTGFTSSLIKRDFTAALSHLKIKPTRSRVKTVSDIWNAEGHTVVDKVANVWLTYRYGIMPTVYSFQDALKAFTAKVDDPSLIETQITIPYENYARSVSTVSTGNTPVIYDQVADRRYWGSVRMVAYVHYNSALSARLSGTNLVDYLKTAWELIPYSFVVDWFINVGGALSQLLLPSIIGSSFVNVSEKHFGSNINSIQNLRPFTYPGMTYVTTWRRTNLSTIHADCFYFYRYPGSLSAVLPPLGSGLSTFSRDFDSATLSWQRLKRLL